MEPLEVFALDADRNRASGPIGYTSLQWSRKYYEPGTFVLEVASDRYSKDWKYICAEGRPECGIINKVEFSDTSQVTDAIDSVILSGFFMEHMLYWRTFLAEEDVWKRLGYDFSVPYDNVFICSKAMEAFMQDLVTVEPSTITGESKIVSPQFKSLGEFVYSELQSIGAAPRITYDFVSDSVVATVWRGLDRTQSQNVNPYAVFSDTWGTMHNFTASDDDSNYKNKCYVLYDYEVPLFWNGDGSPRDMPIYEPEEVTDEEGSTTINQKLVGWEIPCTRNCGSVVARLDDDEPDKETYIDNRSNVPEFDSTWERKSNSADVHPEAPAGLRAKYDAWPTVLMNEGLELLRNDYSKITNLDTGTLTLANYMTDWDLGDKVDVLVDVMDMVTEARIIGVNEVHESNESSVSIEIGDALMTRSKKARLL